MTDEKRNEWTPGPWHVAQHPTCSVLYVNSEGGGHGDVAVLYGDDDNTGNARLIAAAPRLYEALEKCAGLIPYLVKAGEYLAGTQGVLDAARAALRAARGEE